MQPYHNELRPYVHGLPGRLIAFTGCDGVGKSTLLREGVDAVRRRGHPVRVVSLVPRSAWSEEPLASYVHDPVGAMANGEVLPLLSRRLYAHRLAAVEAEVIPALRSGTWVFVDRYLYTAWAESLTFGLGAQAFAELVTLSQAFPAPDLVVLVQASTTHAIGRIRARRAEREFVLPPEYLDRLAANFELATRSANTRILRNDGPLHESVERLEAILRELDDRPGDDPPP